MKIKCTQCLKFEELCVCSSLKSLPTRLQVLILQHPQEPGEALSTARIAHLSLPNSTLKIGLSWPNLSKALGREATSGQWAVLYLGSGVQTGEASQVPQKGRSSGATDRSGKTVAGSKPILQFVTKKGTPTDAPERLEGIVILDGTWTQAKALWWRNAWLLKLRRMILQPSQPSLYRELRKEPRKECLSTIESIAETLVALGEPQETGDGLREVFSALLEKQRAKTSKPKSSTPEA